MTTGGETNERTLLSSGIRGNSSAVSRMNSALSSKTLQKPTTTMARPRKQSARARASVELSLSVKSKRILVVGLICILLCYWAIIKLFVFVFVFCFRMGLKHGLRGRHHQVK